jgi:hypothetical protein
MLSNRYIRHLCHNTTGRGLQVGLGSLDLDPVLRSPRTSDGELRHYAGAHLLRLVNMDINKLYLQGIGLVVYVDSYS